jgi:hypothetical protein
MKLRYLLGYLWSALTVLPGLLLLALAKATGCVGYTFWSGPAFVVNLRGRFATWMATPNEVGNYWYGHTVGFVVFLYPRREDCSNDVFRQHIEHERRHVAQQLVFGPLHPLVYALSFLWGLIRYQDAYEGYRRCIWERDARKAAGEE